MKLTYLKTKVHQLPWSRTYSGNGWGDEPHRTMRTLWINLNIHDRVWLSIRQIVTQIENHEN
jgi:hypothetical protein